jgi:hypothetical protein
MAAASASVGTRDGSARMLELIHLALGRRAPDPAHG